MNSTAGRHSTRLTRRRLQSRLRGALAYAVLTVASLIAVLPVYWMIATSLKSRWDAFRIPPMWLFKPTFSN